MKNYMIALMTASALPMTVAIGATPTIAQENVVEAAKEGRVATEVFGRRPVMRSPRLSPDGSKLVYMLSDGGKRVLAWLDLKKPGSAPHAFAAGDEVREAGDRTIAGWRWVGEEDVVFTLQSREILGAFGGQRVDIGRLVGYNINTKKTTPLAWDRTGANGSSIQHINHKTGKFLLQRDRTDVSNERLLSREIIEVDVKTGKFTTVMPINPVVGSWIVDGNGVVRAGTGGSRSGKQRLLYRSTAKGTMKTVSNSKDESFTGAQVVPSLFTSEPDTAYASSNKDNYRRIYKVNMKTMELSEPIFEVKGRDVNGVIPNWDRTDIVGFSAFENGYDVDVYTNPKLKQVQQFLDEDFGKYNTSIVTYDRDFTTMIVFVGKPSQSGGYYLYDLAGGKFQLLSWNSNTLKNAELNPMKAVTYKASDGMEIEAIMTYPRHRKHRKNLPVIVMPHGGPFGATSKVGFGFFPWAQSMAEAGYVVIEPNYRGSGGYGKDFVKEGRKPNGYGKRMQDDLNDAVTWFSQKGLIDKNRACIMGWSYGGYATARGAQRDGDFWKCAIAGAGVYDFPKMKAYDTRVFGEFGANFQATASNIVDISSARNPKGKWSPILIVAGLRDARIPIEQSRTLVSRLKGAGKKAGTDFKYIEQKKGTHNLPYEDVHIEWLEEAEKWADRFNPAYIASDPDKAPKVTIRSKR